MIIEPLTRAFDISGPVSAEFEFVIARLRIRHSAPANAYAMQLECYSIKVMVGIDNLAPPSAGLCNLDNTHVFSRNSFRHLRMQLIDWGGGGVGRRSQPNWFWSESDFVTSKQVKICFLIHRLPTLSSIELTLDSQLNQGDSWLPADSQSRLRLLQKFDSTFKMSSVSRG